MANKDMGKLLVYGMAAFQAYAMGRAGYVYDPDGWSVNHVNVAYLILGAVLNLIIANAALKLPSLSANFSALKSLLPKLGKKADDKEKRQFAKDLKKMMLASKQNLYSQIGFYVLMGFSVAMIAPAHFIVWSVSLSFADWFVGFMAFVGAVLPDFAITVGGFISSDAVSDAERRSATVPAKSSDAGSDAERPRQRRSAKKLATVSDVVAKIYQCECGEKFVDRFKYSGHTRTCTVRKEIKASKDLIPVDIQLESKAVKK